MPDTQITSYDRSLTIPSQTGGAPVWIRLLDLYSQPVESSGGDSKGKEQLNVDLPGLA